MVDYPNVPDVPGVPPLQRDPLSAPSQPFDLATADGAGVLAGAVGQQWGIFKDGAPVVVAETVVTLDYRQTWSISDYPLEEGAFESYNKVHLPFDARVQFASGQSDAAREELLNSISAIAPTLELYDVVTPEVVYQSVNVNHYDYRRSSTNGVGLLKVDVWLQQVRVTATAAFSNTKSPSGASAVNGGTVQTTTPTQPQAAQAAGVN